MRGKEGREVLSRMPQMLCKTRGLFRVEYFPQRYAFCGGTRSATSTYGPLRIALVIAFGIIARFIV